MTFKEQKEIRKEAQALYLEGKSKRDIYNLFKEKAAPNGQAWLSALIAAMLTEETKAKYKIHFILLSVLVMISFLIWMYYPYEELGPIKYLVYILILILISTLVIQLQNFNAGILSGIMVLSFSTILGFASKSYRLHEPLLALLLILPVSSLLTAYWLRKKLVPEMDLWGRVRKDENGNYIFN